MRGAAMRQALDIRSAAWRWQGVTHRYLAVRRDPHPALPRKREREMFAARASEKFDAASRRNFDQLKMSRARRPVPRCAPSPALAGEGWGGGRAASAVSHTAILRCRTGAPTVRLSAASMMVLASMP